MPGKRHSAETRTQVMAALLAGQGVMAIAEEFGLPESTVRNWKRTLPESVLTEVNAKKQRDIEALLFDYVEQNLKTLKAQSEVASDRGYLEKQPASELAVLHGVIADKTTRILAALEPVEVPEKPYAEA